jgi:uncharacterized protein
VELVKEAIMTKPVQRMQSLLIAFVWAWSSALAGAVQADECPLARQPYSTQTPLIDLMLDPRSQNVLKQSALYDRLPAKFKAAETPGMASILTLRLLNGASAQSASELDRLDGELARIPLTSEAKKRRCARYDTTPPTLPADIKHPAILVFDKITGFRDAPSVDAARKMLETLATRQGWAVVFSDNGAVINPKDLKRFDAIVWNNVSGDVLTLRQRKALKSYIEHGGGFVAVHGSGGDPVYIWDWYVDTLIGARFIGHSSTPHFPEATVRVENPAHPITAGLPQSWSLSDEWYSFRASPRKAGVNILLTLDEASYSPKGNLAMGDHPIAWSHCVGKGRAFYTAIGHRPEAYADANVAQLITQSLSWAMNTENQPCKDGL